MNLKMGGKGIESHILLTIILLILAILILALFYPQAMKLIENILLKRFLE